jgi:predicted lipoprotein with Yx(FWY)xxD motif
MPGCTFTVRLLGATATVLLASACGSTVTSGAGTTATTTAASGGVLGVATTSLGPILVDSKGRTVYLLTADKPGHSSCSAACLQYWPLVPAPAGKAVTSVSGVGASLSVTKATSGVSMVTAGRWPLYTFAQDAAPGDIKGEGVTAFGGTWYAVSPSGAAVRTPASSPATSAPTTSGGGGGGAGNGY